MPRREPCPLCKRDPGRACGLCKPTKAIERVVNASPAQLAGMAKGKRRPRRRRLRIPL